MEKNGGKTDYSRITSRQIAVYKTDKALLELVDSLKPAGASYPAHIHASGEEDEEGYSLIRLQELVRSLSVCMQTSARMRHYTCIPEYSAVCRLFSCPGRRYLGKQKKKGMPM